MSFPASPANGQIATVNSVRYQYNTSNNYWARAPINFSSNTTFAPGTPIYENTQAVTANTTVSANSSAMSVGPMSINNGVTVTLLNGSRWVIL